MSVRGRAREREKLEYSELHACDLSDNGQLLGSDAVLLAYVWLIQNLVDSLTVGCGLCWSAIVYLIYGLLTNFA